MHRMRSRDAWLIGLTMLFTWYVSDPDNFEQLGVPYLIGFGILVMLVWGLGRVLLEDDENND